MADEPAKTLRGTIRTVKQNFGFIREELTRQDYFFHVSELVNCKFVDLEPGLEVEFFGLIEEKGQNQGKRKAHDVVLIDPVAEGGTNKGETP